MTEQTKTGSVTIPFTDDIAVREVVADLMNFWLDGHGNARFQAMTLRWDASRPAGGTDMLTYYVPVARVLIHKRSIRVLRDRLNELCELLDRREERPDQHAKEKQRNG
jgi:hypothetical protein